MLVVFWVSFTAIGFLALNRVLLVFGELLNPVWATNLIS